MPVERIKPQSMKKIKGQPHLLAYITPNEVKKLKALGGQETMTKEGIPAYPEYDNYGFSSQADFDSGDVSRSNDPNVRGEGPGQNRVTASQLAAINKAEKEKEATRKAKNKNITKFGYNKPKSKFGGILSTIAGMLMGIPGLGLLTGGFDKLKGGLGSLNETLGDFREKTTGFRTQQEWEDARTQRQLQSRLDNLYDRKAKGKGFSQKNIDMLESQYGLSPSTAQNVLTGRDLKGFTESRGLQIPTSNEVVDTPNVPMGTPWDNPYKAPDSPEWTSWEVPPGMMNDAYQDNLKFFDNLNKGIVENNEPPMVNTDNVMQGSVLDATPKKGIMEMISDAIFSPAGAAEISPTMGIENTPMGPMPTGDVGLNASGRLGNLSATIDAIDALKGESVNPALNYSGTFDNTLLGGQTNVYGNYSDDAQNIGLNFNNDKGLYGGVEYDAISGEPRFDIGFRKTFEPGGGLSSLFTRRR